MIHDNNYSRNVMYGMKILVSFLSSKFCHWPQDMTEIFLCGTTFFGSWLLEIVAEETFLLGVFSITKQNVFIWSSIKNNVFFLMLFFYQSWTRSTWTKWEEKERRRASAYPKKVTETELTCKTCCSYQRKSKNKYDP